MRCLPQISFETALEASPFGTPYSEPLSLERELTRIHQAFSDGDPGGRELAILRVQLPASFQPLQAGDVFAGRILYPLVSFSPEPGGLGFSCRSGEIREVAARHSLDGQAKEEVDAMLDYWETRTTQAKTRSSYPAALNHTLPTDAWSEVSGIAFPLYRMAGSVLDYSKLLHLGLPGLREELRKGKAHSTDQATRRLLSQMMEALDLIECTRQRYALEAREAAAIKGDSERADFERIASDLDVLEHSAPRHFSEAIQLLWLYALHSGTWNYGRLDDVLGPYLAADCDSGHIDDAEALRLLQGWWRLMKAYANQYNNRVIVGGKGRLNEAAADRFALLAMEASRTVRLNEPQLTLRFHAEQNPVLMGKALTVLGEGTTFPLLYNDDVNVPAVAKAFGVDLAEASDYVPYGCGEYVLATKSFGTPNGVINLAKALEAALHGGRDPISGIQTGPAAPTLEEMTTFRDVWHAYQQQVSHHIAALAEHQRLEYDVTGKDAPFLLLTILMDDCVSRGRPVFSGGIRYLGGTVETYGNINTSDALHAIEQVVFVNQEATLSEVVEACDADFSTPDAARIQRMLKAVPKYGNDDPGADSMAQRVHDHVCESAQKEASKQKLSSYLVVLINNWCNVVLGGLTGATADGRKAGESFANANNPSPGSDRNGITAFLNSISLLRSDIHAGAVQNMKFSRELFGRSRAKLEAMLKAYWKRGGTQAMITVVSTEDLRAAMIEPEKWGHLMVRVGGFSSRFVDLPHGAQLEILQRTCHE